MFNLSSPLALRGQLKLNTTTAIFLVVFLLTLNNSSCEARHLRVRGKHYSSKLPSLPPKDVREVNATKDDMMRLSMVDRVWSNFDAAMRNEVVAVEMKMKAVASSGASSCDSLRKRFQEIKARSRMRERSMLGADTKSEQQLVPNATTAYTAETLVAMDYLEAHPAPAVHNK